MVKKLLLFCVFFFILATSFATWPARAQEPPSSPDKKTFDEAFTAYVGFSEDYNKAHETYVLKKAQYVKFQSLKSRQDAYDATLVMLQKRDDVVTSYLEVLRAKVDEGIGIPDAKKESLFFRIDEEISWYSDHKANLSTTGSLQDLVSDSNLASARWKQVESLAYESMSVLAQGKVADFTKRSSEIFDNTKNKIEAIRTDQREGYSFSSEKFIVLDRWVFEADGRLVRGKQKQSEAEILINELASHKKEFLGQYDSIISVLSESQIFLKESNSFIKEVVKQIKTAED